MRLIYLDNNATTMTAPEVVEAMRPFWSEQYGNPSSMHTFGGKVKRYVDEGRQHVARLLRADAQDMVFTGGGSESNNLAIRGVLEALGGHKRHIVTTRVEHPAVLSVFRHMAKQGYRVSEIPVSTDGSLDMDALDGALTSDTALVSIMWANNETGVIFPMQEIASMVKTAGAIFHVDGVQAAGKIPIDVSSMPIDLLSISGHKLHGPKGIGALYVRRGTKLIPQIIGGHHENNRRAGTENVPGIVGIGKAAELALANVDQENSTVRELRDRLEHGVLSTCKDAQVNGRNRLPNTLNVSFKFVEGEAILIMLDNIGIAASSGSACASGSLQPSHVLRAMGIPFTAAHGSIRFSLSRYNSVDEIDFVVEHMPAIIDRLRTLSPFVTDEVPA